MTFDLDLDIRDEELRQRRAEALRAAIALAALLLEDADLRAALFAVDDRHDLRVLDERGAHEQVAIGVLEEEHLLERNFVARLGIHQVDGDDIALADLQLAAAALN